jgi:hypothetical protein
MILWFLNQNLYKGFFSSRSHGEMRGLNYNGRRVSTWVSPWELSSNRMVLFFKNLKSEDQILIVVLIDLRRVLFKKMVTEICALLRGLRSSSYDPYILTSQIQLSIAKGHSLHSETPISSGKLRPNFGSRPTCVVFSSEVETQLELRRLMLYSNKPKPSHPWKTRLKMSENPNEVSLALSV